MVSISICSDVGGAWLVIFRKSVLSYAPRRGLNVTPDRLARKLVPIHDESAKNTVLVSPGYAVS